jgi:hypothetical protein
MYIVLVGPPAARKGTAMSQAYKFLRTLDIRVSAEATTREALIKALAEATYNEVDTTDALTISMHSSLTVWSQELTVFLGYQNFQLMSDMTDWYDCRDAWTYRTKNMGTDEIIGVFVVLFGATTPKLIASSMPLDAIGGGLTSRMIFIFEPNKGKIVPYPGLSAHEKDLEIQLEEDLARIHLMNGQFRATKKFFNHWLEWYPHQARNPPFEDHRFEGYCDRRANHVLKLSMIISAAKRETMDIHLEDLLDAIRILERTEEKMERTFSGVGLSANAEVLNMVMQDIAHFGEVPRSFLVNKHKNDADNWMMGKILETLEASGFAETITRGNIDYIRKRERKEDPDDGTVH